jgi:hypothetical protein
LARVSLAFFSVVVPVVVAIWDCFFYYYSIIIPVENTKYKRKNVELSFQQAVEARSPVRR